MMMNDDGDDDDDDDVNMTYMTGCGIFLSEGTCQEAFGNSLCGLQETIRSFRPQAIPARML